MNDVDPQAWLADVLARLPDYPAHKIGDLLPWSWKAKPPAKGRRSSVNACSCAQSQRLGALAGCVRYNVSVKRFKADIGEPDRESGRVA
jgi:hypothetical protein